MSQRKGRPKKPIYVRLSYSAEDVNARKANKSIRDALRANGYEWYEDRRWFDYASAYFFAVETESREEAEKAARCIAEAYDQVEDADYGSPTLHIDGKYEDFYYFVGRKTRGEYLVYMLSFDNRTAARRLLEMYRSYPESFTDFAIDVNLDSELRAAIAPSLEVLEEVYRHLQAHVATYEDLAEA